MIIAAIVGFLFGFIGSMPVAGPIAILVFAKAVEKRFRSGLSIAAGAAIAESIYAFLAFWGFSQLFKEYPVIRPVSRAAAAALLMTLGILFVRRKSKSAVEKKDEEQAPAREGWRRHFFLGFSITALNPTLIATWTAAANTLFSTGLIASDANLAYPFGLGAMAGIVVWFSILVYLVRRFRGRFSQATLDRIIRAMGWLLIATGGWFLYKFIQDIV
jgi:threonine/homoserine/homoserine lactone efflux protein